jgi:hypothetical protein
MYYTFLIVDKGALEYIGPFTGALATSFLGRTFTRIQTGFVGVYFLLIVGGLFSFIILIDAYMIFSSCV